MTLLIAFGSFAQDVSYKVKKDNPADVCNAFLNLELLHFEAPFGNFSGTSFCIGGNSYVNYHNKFGGEVLFRRGWLNLSGVTRYQFEIGGFYNLRSHTRVRNQKVVLDTKEYTSGDKRITETKFIKCPAQNMRTLGVRAGFLTNKEAYEDERDVLSPTYAYRWTGVYAGVLLTSQMNYQINTDTYGEAGTMFIRRYYADVTVHPIVSLTDKETDQKNKNAKIGILGVRAGVEFMPAERRKLQGPVYIKVEVGARPLDGLYAMGVFGVNFKRRFAGLGIHEAQREME